MDFLEKIGVGKTAVTIICLFENDAINLSAVLGARTLDANIKIVTLVNNIEVESKLKLAGANFLINPNQISAMVASEYIGQPVAFDALYGILLNEDISAEVDEIEIVEGMQIIGFDINQIDFDDYNIVLIGVIDTKQNHKFIFNPTNIKYTIKQNDILIVIGYKSSIKELKTNFFNNKFLKVQDEK